MATVQEIEAKLAEFEKKLKPIPKGETILKVEQPVEPPEEPTEVEPVPSGGETCLNVVFKQLMTALNPSFVGQNIDNFLVSLYEIPDCEVM
jgi:hypothetical protein